MGRPGTAWALPGEVTLGSWSTDQVVPGPDEPIKIQGPPGGCWCHHPARQAGDKEYLDHGCESGIRYDKRSKEAVGSRRPGAGRPRARRAEGAARDLRSCMK